LLPAARALPRGGYLCWPIPQPYVTTDCVANGRSFPGPDDGFANLALPKILEDHHIPRRSPYTGQLVARLNPDGLLLQDLSARPEAGLWIGDAMPTIRRVGPYRFFFYSGEGHEPPHVHVERNASVAKFWLFPVRLARSGGFGRREIRDIGRIVSEHQPDFLEAWNDYFDD
jgi:hypothetical protein